MAGTAEEVIPDSLAGELLARAMNASRINRFELSRRTGVSLVTICNVYNSKQAVKFSTLYKLLKACGYEIRLKRLKIQRVIVVSQEIQN